MGAATEHLLRELDRAPAASRPSMVRDHLLRSIGEAQREARAQRPEPLSVEWTAARRAAIVACLGIDRVPLKAAPTDSLVREAPHRDFVVEKRLIELIDGLPMPVDVYRPAGTGPWPLVLHIPGHWMENGRLHVDFQRNAITLARAGMLVSVHDPLDEGERFTGWRGHAQIALLAAGVSMIGLLLAEARALLRLLAARPDVDRSRIGVTGASGGGQTSMFLPLVEPLVRAAVPVCFVNTLEGMIEAFTGLNYFGGVDLCNHVPGLADEATFSDVIGLGAPTPSCYINALDDPHFPVEGARVAVADARPYYEAAGAAGALELVEVPGGHGYGEDVTRAACGFFRRVFGLTTAPGSAASEADLQAAPYAVDFMSVAGSAERIVSRQTVEPTWEAERRVLPEPPDSRPIVAALSRRIAGDPPRASPVSPAHVREAFGLYESSPTAAPNIVRTWQVPGASVERVLISPEPGIELALLVFVPERYDRAAPPAVIVSRKGAHHAFSVFDGGELLTRGWVVCACELRGYGETAGVEFELATTALLLRRHLFAQRACDLGAAIGWVFDRAVVGVQFDRTRLTLAAADAETALVARAVAATDARIAALYCREHHASWADLLVQDPLVSPALFVPGAASRVRLQDLAPAGGGPQALGIVVGARSPTDDEALTDLAGWLESVFGPVRPAWGRPG